MTSPQSDGRSHYEVIGVARDASKDEIRDAYRARLDELRESGGGKESEEAVAERRVEIGRLNAAWQTLSDPYQRGRYDAQRESESEEESVEPEAAPEARRAGARLASNEAEESPPTWPPGLRPPPPRARLVAMVIDLVALGVLVGAVQFGGARVIQSVYEDELDQLDEKEDDIDDAEDRVEGAAQARQDAERQAQETAETTPEGGVATTAPATTAPATVPATDAPVTTSAPAPTTTVPEAVVVAREAEEQERRELANLEEEQDDLQGELVPANLGLIVVSLLVALVYLVPSSALSGRTLGKRLLVIRAVRADGSPLGWAGAIRRYGPPVLLAFALLPLLGPLGFFVVLIGILTWPRNPNRQGLHDRIATTLVVDG